MSTVPGDLKDVQWRHGNSDGKLGHLSTIIIIIIIIYFYLFIYFNYNNNDKVHDMNFFKYLSNNIRIMQ